MRRKAHPRTNYRQDFSAVFAFWKGLEKKFSRLQSQNRNCSECEAKASNHWKISKIRTLSSFHNQTTAFETKSINQQRNNRSEPLTKLLFNTTKAKADQINYNKQQQQKKKKTKMTKTVDIGKVNHSPSSALMSLVNIDHELDWTDFNEVVKFLQENLFKVINEVHGFDKLLIDDGNTQLNCPPAPESGDSHGHMLLRTLSEKETSHGITLKREFKVHDCGPDPDNANRHKVEIREDIVKPPEMAEHVVVVSVAVP